MVGRVAKTPPFAQEKTVTTIYSVQQGTPRPLHSKMGPPRKPAQMSVKTTKTPRKTQATKPEFANLDTGEIVNLAQEMKGRMQLIHAARQLEALTAQVAARRKLIVTAHDLLSKAKSLAERGKPRLLAVLTKIINDKNIRFGVK